MGHEKIEIFDIHNNYNNLATFLGKNSNIIFKKHYI